MIRNFSGRPASAAPMGLRVIAILILLPVIAIPVALMMDAVREPEFGAGAIRTGRLAELALRSLGLAAVVAAAASALGLALAWLVERTDLPGRRFFSVLCAVPIAVPSYVMALTWIFTFGPGGLVTPLSGSWIYGFGGAAVVLTILTAPYVFLPVSVALRRLDRGWEEVAISLGKTRWQTFRQISLPMLRAPLISGGLLVALYCLSEFGAVAMLRCDTFTRVIFLSKDNFDTRNTAIFSLALVGLVLGVIALTSFVSHAPPPGRNLRDQEGASPLSLGKWKWPSFAFVGGFVTLGLAVPVAVLSIKAFGAHKVKLPSQFEPLMSAMLNSLGASGLAALVATVLAVPLAYLAVRYRSRLAHTVDRITLTGFGLPGVVVALALIPVALGIDRALRGLTDVAGLVSPPALYQSLALLVLAYVVQFLPHATNAVRASLAQIPHGLFESAILLGKSAWKGFFKVTLPILAPSLLAAFSIVFLTSMRELPASLILSPNNFSTLTTRIWDYWEEAQSREAALFSLVLLVATAGPLLWLKLFPWRNSRDLP